MVFLMCYLTDFAKMTWKTTLVDREPLAATVITLQLEMLDIATTQ